MTARTVAGPRAPLWVPSDLSTARLAHFVADDVRVADGAAVDTWPDRSGNANAVTGVTTARPVLVTGSLNGHSVVRFDGSNDKMSLASAPVGTALSGSDTPFTVWMVWKKTNNTGTQVALALVATADGATSTLHNLGTSATAYFTARADDTNAVVSQSTSRAPDTSAHVVALRFSGTTCSIFIDGALTSVARSALDVGTSSFTLLRLGASRASAGPFAGDIAEVLVSASAADDSIIQQATRHFGYKYAITVA